MGETASERSRGAPPPPPPFFPGGYRLAGCSGFTTAGGPSAQGRGVLPVGKSITCLHADRPPSLPLLSRLGEVQGVGHGGLSQLELQDCLGVEGLFAHYGVSSFAEGGLQSFQRQLGVGLLGGHIHSGVDELRRHHGKSLPCVDALDLGGVVHVRRHVLEHLKGVHVHVFVELRVKGVVELVDSAKLRVAAPVCRPLCPHCGNQGADETDPVAGSKSPQEGGPLL
mmetsp:Transcript_20197/g.56010  ORF Transcript_20197/g.56010 Transcript_20197/m.56010 type:complete len:225 (+) Transcript_20197:233-907(+)